MRRTYGQSVSLRFCDLKLHRRPNIALKTIEWRSACWRRWTAIVVLDDQTFRPCRDYTLALKPTDLNVLLHAQNSEHVCGVFTFSFQVSFMTLVLVQSLTLVSYSCSPFRSTILMCMSIKPSTVFCFVVSIVCSCAPAGRSLCDCVLKCNFRS